MAENNTISILVNTTDSFEDCWEPFFVLFKKYWPEFNGRIYLNTETKDFQFPGLNIVCIKNNLSHGTWSECLLAATDRIVEDYFLYLQEDYFIHAPVKHKELTVLHTLMKDRQYDCFHVTDQSTPGPFYKKTGNQRVWQVQKNAPYLLSMQAAFWKKESLRQIIVPSESAWELEKKGTKRASSRNIIYMAVSRDWVIKGNNELIPYIFTGIIKGKWNREVTDIFQTNGILVDYSIRGFWDKPRYSLWERVLRKLKK